MSEETNERIEVRHDAEAHRYVIEVDGAQAGFAAYTPREDGAVLDFDHTEIDPSYGGRGLGGKVVSAALADARDTGKRIIPTCPFVVAWLDKHPEFDGEVER